MKRKQYSRFTYKEPHLLSLKVARYYVPTNNRFDIVCDMCGMTVYYDFNPNQEELRLYVVPLEEQVGVSFYSVVEEDQSIQYCKTCRKVIEVAPL